MKMTGIGLVLPALAPLLVIILSSIATSSLVALAAVFIFIIAAAGMTRGLDVFQILGLNAVLGAVGSVGVGGAGRGMRSGSAVRFTGAYTRAVGGALTGSATTFLGGGLKKNPVTGRPSFDLYGVQGMEKVLEKAGQKLETRFPNGLASVPVLGRVTNSSQSRETATIMHSKMAGEREANANGVSVLPMGGVQMAVAGGLVVGATAATAGALMIERDKGQQKTTASSRGEMFVNSSAGLPPAGSENRQKTEQDAIDRGKRAWDNREGISGTRRGQSAETKTVEEQRSRVDSILKGKKSKEEEAEESVTENAAVEGTVFGPLPKDTARNEDFRQHRIGEAKEQLEKLESQRSRLSEEREAAVKAGNADEVNAIDKRTKDLNDRIDAANERIELMDKSKLLGTVSTVESRQSKTPIIETGEGPGLQTTRKERKMMQIEQQREALKLIADAQKSDRQKKQMNRIFAYVNPMMDKRDKLESEIEWNKSHAATLGKNNEELEEHYATLTANRDAMLKEQEALRKAGRNTEADALNKGLRGLNKGISAIDKQMKDTTKRIEALNKRSKEAAKQKEALSKRINLAAKTVTTEPGIPVPIKGKLSSYVMLSSKGGKPLETWKTSVETKRERLERKRQKLELGTEITVPFFAFRTGRSYVHPVEKEELRTEVVNGTGEKEAVVRFDPESGRTEVSVETVPMGKKVLRAIPRLDAKGNPIKGDDGQIIYERVKHTTFVVREFSPNEYRIFPSISGGGILTMSGKSRSTAALTNDISSTSRRMRSERSWSILGHPVRALPKTNKEFEAVQQQHKEREQGTADAIASAENAKLEKAKERGGFWAETLDGAEKERAGLISDREVLLKAGKTQEAGWLDRRIKTLDGRIEEARSAITRGVAKKVTKKAAKKELAARGRLLKGMREKADREQKDIKREQEQFRQEYGDRKYYELLDEARQEARERTGEAHFAALRDFRTSISDFNKYRMNEHGYLEPALGSGGSDRKKLDEKYNTEMASLYDRFQIIKARMDAAGLIPRTDPNRSKIIAAIEKERTAIVTKMARKKKEYDLLTAGTAPVESTVAVKNSGVSAPPISA